MNHRDVGSNPMRHTVIRIMAELADALDLGSSVFGRESSSLSNPTNILVSWQSWTIAPVLKTGGPDKGPGGSNPSLTALRCSDKPAGCKGSQPFLRYGRQTSDRELINFK